MAELAELDRVTTTFATTMRERTLQVQGTIATFAAAAEASVARLRAATATGLTAPAAAAAPAIGMHLVRVINDRGTPVPVTVVSDLGAPLPVTMIAAPQPEQSIGATIWSKVTGFFASIPSLLSSFAGGLVGELVTGITKPFTGVIAGVELIIMLGRIETLINAVGSVLGDLIGGINGAINNLFDRLAGAGIFPVSELSTTLLGFVENGMALVIAQIRPVMGWAEGLLAGVTDWLAGFLVAAGGWLGQVFDRLPPFLLATLDFVFGTIAWRLRQFMIDAVVTIVGGLDAIGSVLIAAFAHGSALLKHAFDHGLRGLALLVNLVAAVKGVPSRMDVPEVGPAPKRPDFGAVAAAGMREGGFAAREIATMLGQEPPPKPPKRPRFGPMPVLVHPQLQLAPLPGAATIEAATEAAPATLAIVPTVAPALPAATVAARRAETPAAPSPSGRAGTLTVNGGLAVYVRAETIDMANAEETGRRMAGVMLDELDRLVARHGFRRGLPTGPIP